MSTPYSLVFQSFLGRIESNEYTKMSKENAEADFIVLLNIGLEKFHYPKVNIFDKDDNLQIFNVELSYLEIGLIAQLMKVEWLGRKIFNIDLIRQKLSTSEFRLTSQAAHLESLINLKLVAENEFAKVKSVYSYSRNGMPDYSGLAGGD